MIVVGARAGAPPFDEQACVAAVLAWITEFARYVSKEENNAVLQANVFQAVLLPARRKLHQAVWQLHEFTRRALERRSMDQDMAERWGVHLEPEAARRIGVHVVPRIVSHRTRRRHKERTKSMKNGVM
jgi:hypothetical protein